MLDLLMKYAQGNPGALTFMMELVAPENVINIIPIAIKLEEIPSLRGTNLYVLWSDLCNKDMNKVARLCKNCPNDILADACNRQDYSGRELIKPYFF
jgi:hypothetical protein